MLHLLYRLYGRTVVVSLPLLINLYGFLKALQHGGAVLGGFDDLLGGVDDPLREVRRV